MLLASVIKSVSPLLVQWCLILPISFFFSDVAAWQAHGPNPVTTAYLLDLSYSFTIVVVVICFLSASPYSNDVYCLVLRTPLFFC